MILAFAGKSISLNHVMYICSIGECKPIRNNTPSLSTSNMIWNFWFGTDTSLKQNWLEMMTDTIYHLPHNNMSRLEIASYTQSAVEAYCDGASRKGLAPKLNLSFNSFERLQNKFWRIILHFSRKYFKSIKINSYTNRVENFVRILNKRGILIDEDDFASVNSSINRYNEYKIRENI